ncbi:DUF2500 domain-containing protein [Lysinibacillus parviboronicapiens]|uniref:DUF2500 domain-containing protein n=1 Tax=Lysinibacillus parviboronicapiens TaxID=436516 RepID=UPI0006CFAFCA|nr:DUF2500 domain-containing protein [Lysinibacillus parviboronicapiens]
MFWADSFHFESIFISVIFIIVFGTFAFVMINGITQWAKNNAAPVLTVPAKIVTKRTNTRGGSGNSAAHTTYYVTFEVQNGDRIELQLNGRKYGQLADGDFGLLTFQGTRFQIFERHKKESSE